MDSGYSGGGLTFSCARGRCTRKAAQKEPTPSPKPPTPRSSSPKPPPAAAAASRSRSPPAAAAAAPSSSPRPAAAAAKKSKSKKKKKAPIIAPKKNNHLPLLQVAHNSNNNGFEEVGAKPKMTKEERAAIQAADKAEQKRIERQQKEQQAAYKASLLSGYASHVGEIKAKEAKEKRLELAKLTKAANARVSSAAAAAAAIDIEIPAESGSRNTSVEAATAAPSSRASSTASSVEAEVAAAAAPTSRASSKSSRKSASTASSAASSRSTASHRSVEAAQPPQLVMIPLAPGVTAAQLAQRPLGVANMVIAPPAAAGGGGGGPPLIVAEPPVAPGPMSKPHLQGFALRIATEINNIVNDPQLIQTFMQRLPGLAASFINPNQRFAELYRYMVKGSTADALLSENISLAYSPKAHVGDFPFNINSDVDTSIIINPNLQYQAFELIRVFILYAIVTYAENMVKFIPPENTAITAELAEQGYEYDGNSSTNRIIYERVPDQKSIEPPVLLKLYDKIMNVSYKNIFNWRIIENLNNLNVTVLRLFTRTKVGGRPAPIDVLDVVVPSKTYSLLPISWTYSNDYEIFSWPSRHYQFPVFGAFAQFFERTYGLFNYYSEAAMAKLPDNATKEEMVAKKRRWQRSLLRLRTLAKQNPKTRYIYAQLAMFPGLTIDGVPIGSILAEFNKA
jgi:hypothetical protein